MIVGGKGEAIEVVVIGKRARITVEDAEGSARIYLKHPAKTVALIKELMQVVKAAPQFIPELLNELADKLEGNDVHRVYGSTTLQGDEMRAEILKALTEYVDKHGIAPSRRELIDLVGLKSTSHINTHLQTLAEQGYITLYPNQARGIVLKQSPELCRPKA